MWILYGQVHLFTIPCGYSMARYISSPSHVDTLVGPYKSTLRDSPGFHVLALMEFPKVVLVCLDWCSLDTRADPWPLLDWPSHH
jgi:hypothetical protein